MAVREINQKRRARTPSIVPAFDDQYCFRMAPIRTRLLSILMYTARVSSAAYIAHCAVDSPVGPVVTFRVARPVASNEYEPLKAPLAVSAPLSFTSIVPENALPPLNATKPLNACG